MVRLTTAQRDWLIHLRDQGPSISHRRGRAAFICRKNGWVEWMMKGPDGQELPASEVLRRFASVEDRHSAGWHYLGDTEVITEAGRLALKTADDASNDQPRAPLNSGESSRDAPISKTGGGE